MFTLGPYDLCYQFEQGDQEFKCPPSKKKQKTKNTEFILAFVLFACFFPFSFGFSLLLGIRQAEGLVHTGQAFYH